MNNHQALVKICGNTNSADLLAAAQNGADFVGVIVNFPPSPRNVSLETARELRRAATGNGVAFVLLSVNSPIHDIEQLREELQPDVVQLHGDETPDLVQELKQRGATVWVAAHEAQRAHAMLAAGADAILVDARAVSSGETIYGGTGRRSDWQLARELVQSGARVILAGGLSPETVDEGIRDVQPWAVDVSSGVEASKGIKDHAKVAAFIAAAQKAR